MKKGALAIVLLLIFSSLAHAQAHCFTGFGSRDIMISLAIIIMILIVAFVYMLSRLMQRQDWEAWARNESYQVVISCILAVSMVALADLACFASIDIARGNPFEIANGFLDTNYQDAITLLYQLFGIKATLDYMAGFQINAATNPMVVMSMFPGVQAISQNVNTFIWIISLIAANLMVQKIIIEIIRQTAFTILLPVGLILRVFPPLRDAGSFMIAVAFSFYIVFPLTYVMASEVMAQMPEEQVPTFYGIAGFPILGPFSFFIVNIFIGPVELLFRISKDLNLLLAATFFPALNITITVTFIRSLSRAIIRHTG